MGRVEVRSAGSAGVLCCPSSVCSSVVPWGSLTELPLRARSRDYQGGSVSFKCVSDSIQTHNSQLGAKWHAAAVVVVV